MRKLLVATVLSTSLFLGACASTGGGGTSPIIQQIIQDVQMACGYSPAESFISQLVATLFPGTLPTITQINQIISTVCAMAPPPPSASRRAARAAPYYPGTHIRIRGQWLR
jgi:hypothetical protein